MVYRVDPATALQLPRYRPAKHVTKRYQGYAPKEMVESVCYEDIRATPLLPSDPCHPRYCPATAPRF